jgi:hypothetical protein
VPSIKVLLVFGSFEDVAGIGLTGDLKRVSSACDAFLGLYSGAKPTRAYFLNRVTWTPRLLVIGLVAFALLAMAPQMRSIEDDEENSCTPEFAIVVSRIDGSLSFRGTDQGQESERDAAPTAPALTSRGVRAREAKFGRHGGRSILTSSCLLRC